MENYICINGKKAELTEEQLKALGIEIRKKNPFKRVSNKTPFYYITNKGMVEYGVELRDFHCNHLYDVANYCIDKALMEQRALHETLNRLLWRYSMEHDGDKIKYLSEVYEIKRAGDEFIAIYTAHTMLGRIAFYNREIAENAIKEIVEPFMKKHPDFVW